MFTPIKNTKVYEQVIIQIKSMIKDGTLKRGDKLPSERELVEQLGVSRASIREALRALEMIGLVECKQGEGNFIASAFQDTLFEPLSIMFMLNECKVQEIFDLRKIIEVETVALASKEVTEEELQHMEELLQSMRTCDDEDERVKIDMKFHYKIAQASRNFLIVSILNAVASLMDSFIKDARKNIINNQHKDVIDEQHESILQALKNGDPEEATEAMRKHMELINENLIKQLR
ncbi:FadR/GntR family transcriptional regulator [Clostridium sp.]|jgi:GntR family transcriptional regulator, transcriptional repressor for pyruvate dehydrogenase complex|uniref:FadR/GntR family transcriptional regulator n=1 Tax=Clostridium sp. TaxID=1506 RepID=UPI0039F464B3